MKKCLSAVITIIMVLNGCRTGTLSFKSKASGTSETEMSALTRFMEPSTWLLGYIDPLLFSRVPHSEWYLRAYDAYQPDLEVLGKLSKINKDHLSIKIVMGTWCPDSRREVPRFIKILDLWGFPIENVTFIGVDNTKIAPVGGYEELKIERVPTFIILENKVEKGRIIENPVTSLEQDMLNILTRNEK